jgi:quercetin dioxygenase-like cupin family protein
VRFSTEEEDEMRHMILTLFMMTAVGVFAIAEGRAPIAQTPTGPQIINLLRTDVAGPEGKLSNVSNVELPSGAVDARDSHLGVEVVYVLEGTGSLEVDGKPPVALKPGTVIQFAPKHHHVLKNTSRTQTLKVLIVDLVETGQPHLMLANRETRQQKEARQQNEGCQISPNGDLSQQKTNEQDSSTMKGLVF